MGLFKSKDEKVNALMEKISLSGLEEKDYETLRDAMVHFSIAGNAISTTVGINAESATAHATLATVNQNWIIIRQLIEINEKLDRIINK